MFFLQGTIKKLFSLFDDSIKIQLDDEEKSALERSSEKSFLEGITYWTEKTGVYSDCGQLKFQKIVTHSNMIGDFLGNLIDLLNFPGYLSIDFSGTMRNDKGLIYNWGSQNSGILIHNDQNVILLEDPETQKELSNKFRHTDYKTYLHTWFDAHDLVRDLTTSGIIPERLMTIMVFYEPTTVSVSKLLKLD